VLVSVGMIAALEDEAELAFMLGHELAQAATGDAARRLVRLGLQQVARERREVGRNAWAEAALDLVKLGYGRRAELDADERALRALLDQGYDAQSALRFLRRVEARSALGDVQVAEYVLAHPPPLERLRRLECLLADRVDVGPGRVNRELFRRAAGHHVLTTQLEPVRTLSTEAAGPAAGSAAAILRRPIVGIGLGVLLALLLYVLLDALL
jgi:predicted Zn-dependent protease